MKPIKIDPANAEKIEATLKAVNGKAHEHAFTTFRAIDNLAEDAESALFRVLGAKKHFPGATYNAESGDSVATAYKYTRLGTVVVLERRSSAWYLTHVAQEKIWSSGGDRTLYLTPEQDEIAVAYTRKWYIVENQPRVETGYRIYDTEEGALGWFTTYEAALTAFTNYAEKRGCAKNILTIMKVVTTTKSGISTVEESTIYGE